MMLNKRLIGMIGGVKKYIGFNVAFQWTALLANIFMIVTIGSFFDKILSGTTEANGFIKVIVVFLIAVSIRFVCTVMSVRMGFLSTKKVKIVLREKIYEKILEIGPSYRNKVKTADIIQVAGEGVEQLETYFGKYLPQFFYSLIAPITLFIALSSINVAAPAVLLVCVPLIPAAIIFIQKKAKKLFSKYWGAYTDLGADFLENLRGLTTLKIFRADENRHEIMDEKSESFRISTMNVLKMQLNSVTVMDLIAYGGAAIGIIVAVTQYYVGNMSFGGCFAIILLSSEFFIPLRLLGSFFHVAMNGMSACDKIFELLDIPVPGKGVDNFADGDIKVFDMSFSYGNGKFSLDNINMTFKKNQVTSIVGESGSGKSTIAFILTGRKVGYTGDINLGGLELSRISPDSLNSNMTIIKHDSHIFKGTVRDNLIMAKNDLSDEDMWSALRSVSLENHFRNDNGLESRLAEGGSNISGGQRQRLALARALLHDTPIYIFDEATSNVDVESENIINEVIREMAKSKTVLIISHRLANVVDSDHIYVIDDGEIKEEGDHESLLNADRIYAKLYKAQKELESYSKENRSN